MSAERTTLPFLGILAAPAILLGVSLSGTKETKSLSSTEKSSTATSSQTALNIRNCISTTLPHSPNKNNLFCKDLLETIAAQNQTEKIQGCENIPAILDEPPTAPQIDTLRNCASAAYLALEKK